MCSKSFTRSLGLALIPLALCCIIANVLLYFPNVEVKHVQEDHLTGYVWFFTGIVGGGVVMVLPVLVFMNLERCANCCGNEGSAMCSSVLAALVGLAGAGYCFVISDLALIEGPYCLHNGTWTSPFANQSGDYLFDRDTWSKCEEPLRVVEWNVTLFSILLGLSGLECIICAVQLVNGLVAAVCRPCCYKQRYSLNA
ncbi:transmembrane 4 L6 family member 18 [Anguilla anguilla]|uniref:transmembrane 4 L6 family member 18 n=1 Tax=Anguilla anguilla TaxID=7936 RepID=UPI0015AC0E9F|nr:transmembrane 4 L6 family member 18 [Anguilla anguilla]